LALIAEQLSGKVHREKMLCNHLRKFHGDKIIILDCPPNLGLMSINAIYAATHLFIPVNYSRYALEGMVDLLNVIKEVREDEPFEFKIIRNNFDIRNSQTNQFIEHELSNFKDNLFITKIRKCESINQAQINEESIFSFDDKSNGAIDFLKLANEVEDYLYEQIENQSIH
jgi:chromosome partitioning protein